VEKPEALEQGDPTRLAADLSECVALLAMAVMRLTPDLPERQELANVLRRIGDHIEALDREDVLLPVEMAWLRAARPTRS
jgi:hypothetical protein